MKILTPSQVRLYVANPDTARMEALAACCDEWRALVAEWAAAVDDVRNTRPMLASQGEAQMRRMYAAEAALRRAATDHPPAAPAKETP